MEDKLSRWCETCGRDLNIKIQYLECFDKNHTIRLKGLFTIDSSNFSFDLTEDGKNIN